MDRKQVIFFAALFLLSALLQVQAKEFKIATVAPDGSSWMQEMRRGAGEIAERTQDRVTLKFYPGGIMGDEKNVLRKIRIGQLHGAALTTLGLARIYPENQIYNLPLKFETYEEVDYVRARMDAGIIKGLEERGFIAFGLGEGGFIYIMSQVPVHRISDLKDQRVWLPEGDTISLTLMDVAGISPVTLPLTDVLTGLQTGLITTIGSTTSFAIALQWHTKIKYLTEAPLFYAYGTFVIQRKAFNKLNQTDQAVVRDVLGRVVEKLNQQTRKDNESAKQALLNQGVKLVMPGEQDWEELRQVSSKAVKALAKERIYTPEMLRTLDAYLEAAHESKAKTAEKK